MTTINGPQGFLNPYKQITLGQKSVADAQRKSTESILGLNNEDPNTIRHEMFKYALLTGMGRDREAEEVQRRKQDQQALKDTIDASKPAT